MNWIRLHPYNRDVILFGRWHVPHAPAYGWGRAMRRPLELACRVTHHIPGVGCRLSRWSAELDERCIEYDEWPCENPIYCASIGDCTRSVRRRSMGPDAVGPGDVSCPGPR